MSRMLWVLAVVALVGACRNPSAPILSAPNAMQSCPYEGCKDGNITGQRASLDYAISW